MATPSMYNERNGCTHYVRTRSPSSHTGKFTHVFSERMVWLLSSVTLVEVIMDPRSGGAAATFMKVKADLHEGVLRLLRHQLVEWLIQAVQGGCCSGLRLGSAGMDPWPRAMQQEFTAFEFDARFGWADLAGRRCGLMLPAHGLLDCCWT